MGARVMAARRWPYMSTLLFSLRLVERPPCDVPTMAVDQGLRLYYSKEFVLDNSAAEMATVLLHECLHVLLEHPRRFNALQEPRERHEIWNIVADAGINEVLAAESMPFPARSGVRVSDLEHLGVTKEMTTEGMYWLVRDSFTVWRTDCGSGSHGVRADHELADDDDVNPATGSASIERVRAKVASDIRSHAQAGGASSSLLRDWAEAFLQPTIDWRRALAGQVRATVATHAGRVDYSFARPSRRAGGRAPTPGTPILPGMRQPPPPRVCAVVDTSGSIDEDVLTSFVAELLGIVRAVGLSGGIRVIPCDAVAYESTLVRSQNSIAQLALRGGGGTDMREGIAAALRERPRPELVVVLTDGYTPWPEQRPPVPVVIVLSEEPDGEDSTPGWAMTIRMDPNPQRAHP